MKDKIKQLYSLVTSRLPRHYEIELRVYDTPSQIIKAYAEDIDSDFDTTFEWYRKYLNDNAPVEDGELYTSPSTPADIGCITTTQYIMVASKLLKDMGKKEIIYLFLRELGLAYYSKKEIETHPIMENKIKKFARRWYKTMKKEGLLDGDSKE